MNQMIEWTKIYEPNDTKRREKKVSHAAQPNQV